MSLPLAILVLLAALLICPQRVSAQTGLVACDGDRCGDRLVAAGWQRIAACNDHNWSYLLQKGPQIVLCRGVAGRAGPFETPCEEFKGNLEQYRILAQKPLAERQFGECWNGAAVTGGN